MDFIGAVNRVLRINQIIAGDDDAIASFSEDQHRTTIELAKIAVQEELINLISEKSLPAERKVGEIITVAGTRVYNLPTNFLRFFGKQPYMRSTQNPTRYIYEFEGGYENVRHVDHNWDTNESNEPYAWYFEPNNAQPKQVGFIQIPNVSLTYNFDYESHALVESEVDTLPFQNELENTAFSSMAARRFLMNDGQLTVSTLDEDPIWSNQKSSLMRLIRPTEKKNKYGRGHYGGTAGNHNGRY